MSDELKEWDYATRTIVQYGQMRKGPNDGPLEWFPARDLPDSEITLARYEPPMCEARRIVGETLLLQCQLLDGHNYDHHVQFEGVDFCWRREA